MDYGKDGLIPALLAAEIARVLGKTLVNLVAI